MTRESRKGEQGKMGNRSEPGVQHEWRSFKREGHCGSIIFQEPYLPVENSQQPRKLGNKAL